MKNSYSFLTLAFLASTNAFSQTNLISDPSFDIDWLQSWEPTRSANSPFNPTVSHVTPSAILLQNFGQFVSGRYLAFFNGGNATNGFGVNSINQSLNLQDTGLYRLSFSYGFRGMTGSTRSLNNNLGVVKIGGVDIVRIAVTNSGTTYNVASTQTVAPLSTGVAYNLTSNGVTTQESLALISDSTITGGWTNVTTDINLNTGLQDFNFEWRYQDLGFLLDNISLIFIGNGGSFPDASDTKNSFANNALAIRFLLNQNNTKIASNLMYDCTVYDQKNLCISLLGSHSDSKSFDMSSQTLIMSSKINTHLRFGGYLDQSMGTVSFGGISSKQSRPGFGFFGAWSQNGDESGLVVRVAFSKGKSTIETKREISGTAEAGFGRSNINSLGYLVEVSKGYVLDEAWSARPYIGYRKSTSKRDGYIEESSVDVTAPLTYSSVKQTTETLTAGATFAHMLSAKTTMYLTAGIEHDLKNRIGDYAATSSTIGEIDSINMSTDRTKTRPTVSFALNHDIDKTQRVGVSLTHRKEAFASGSTTSAFLQYSKGF